jgi:hypothetical protein
VEVSVLWRCRFCGGVGFVEVSVLWRCRFCGGVGSVEVSVLWMGCREVEEHAAPPRDGDVEEGLASAWRTTA